MSITGLRRTDVDEYDINAAKTLLAQHGYVVLKTKSYRQAQERQHIAEAERAYADRMRHDTEQWARTTLHNEIRELQARCTFLYGAARAAGLTVEELRGGWATIGINCPNGKVCEP